MFPRQQGFIELGLEHSSEPPWLLHTPRPCCTHKVSPSIINLRLTITAAALQLMILGLLCTVLGVGSDLCGLSGFYALFLSQENYLKSPFIDLLVVVGAPL